MFRHCVRFVESSSSFIIPVEGTKDNFLISRGSDILLISWEGSNDKITVLEKVGSAREISNKETLHVNDSKVDASGRLWFGTFSSLGMGKFENGAGGLYTLDKNGVRTLLDGVTLSNGLTWNDELKQFYYIDLVKGTIDQYDFDLTKGTICKIHYFMFVAIIIETMKYRSHLIITFSSVLNLTYSIELSFNLVLANLKEIFTIAKHNLTGLPDGMTIDSDGNLWIALFQGKHVIKIDPRKPETLLEKIELPAELVTCPAFGGENLDELYVTTASIEFEGKKYDASGDGVTYKITGTGARGALAPHKFKLFKN